MLLFAIIFLWTPPHFWALSLFVRIRLRQRRRADAAGGRGHADDADSGAAIQLPMVAAAASRLRCSGLPARSIGASAALRRVSSCCLPRASPAAARRIERTMKPERQLFAYSILYLFVLFGVLVADRLGARMTNLNDDDEIRRRQRRALA